MPDQLQSSGSAVPETEHVPDLSYLVEALINNVGSGIYLAQDRKFIFINHFLEGLSGFPASELIGHNTLDFVHPDDREHVRRRAVEALKDRSSTVPSYEYRFIKSSGEIMWVIERISSIEYSGRRAVLGSFMDINRRKLLEEALVVYGERYRNILERMQDSYYELDLHGNFIFVNYATCRNLGYEWGELNGKNYRTIIPEDARKEIFQVFHRVFESTEPNKGFSHKVTRKDGSMIFAESSVSLLLSESGKPVGFNCVSRNVTERKKLEEALSRSEFRYRSILQQMQEAYFECDFSGRYTFANDATCTATGYTREELLGMHFDSIVPAEERDMVANNYKELYRTGKVGKAFTHRIICKDRSTKYIETSVNLVRDDKGQAIRFSSVARDFTEHKQLLDALAESEERYRSILDQLQDAYYEVDLKGHFTFVNNTTCQSLGMSREEMIGRSFRDVTPSSEIENLFQAFNEVYRTGNPNRRYQHMGMRKSGETFYAETSIDLARDGNGNIVGFRALGRDVTERKKLEDDLVRSEEKYRSILEQIEDGYYEVDLVGKYTFANDQACRLMGCSREELLGKNYRDVLFKDDINYAFQAFNRVFRTGKPDPSFACRIVHKDGSLINTEASVTLSRTKTGEITGFRVLSRNITERKRLEEELVSSEEKYRTILSEMEDAYYEVDLKGDFTFVNDACLRDLRCSKDDLLGVNFSRFVVKDDVVNVFNNFNQVYRTGEPNRGFSHRMLRKDGTTGFVEASISLMKNKEGKVVGFRSVSRDVTERKKLEQKLSEMATHDFLTGLPNRILLNDRFYVAVAHAHRNDSKLALMSLDLDSFKAVNDTMGHSAGDELLRMVAIRLTYTLRTSDTVARIGGDEFVLLLQDIHDLEDATSIAEKIVESFKVPFVIEGHYLSMTTSIGLAIYPEEGRDLDILMRKSDAAMYHSKKEGGNRYKVFSDSDRQELKY